MLWPVPVVCVGLSRVQKFIYKVFISTAVELNVPDRIVIFRKPPAHLPIFGGKVAGLYRDLLDRIHARLVLRGKAGQSAVRRVLPLHPVCR